MMARINNLGSNGRTSRAMAARTIVAGHAAETAPAVIVVEALPPIKETSGKKSPNAAGSVNCTGIHGVVNLQSHKETGCRLVEESTNEAGENCAAALHVSAARSDETKPERMPLHRAPTSYLRTSTNFSKKTVMPHVAAERMVFMATCVKVVIRSAR